MMYEVWNQLQTTGYVLVDQANIVGLAAEKKKKPLNWLTPIENSAQWRHKGKMEVTQH